MASPYYFDKRVGEAACEFLERFCYFTEGEWAGRHFTLAPWQRHHTSQIFGWRRKADGMRRYRFVRGWVPRKNGKTEWFAGLAHLLLVGDAEPGAQVYSHALDKPQASILFQKAANMAAFSQDLTQLYEVTKQGIFCPAVMGSIRALSGEAFGKHGLNPHAAIGDEAHAWADGDLHTFLIQGMGSRRQPLDLTISTAGEIKTYGYELFEQSIAVLDDPSLDPETYVFHYGASTDDDWTDPRVWAKANPNLDVSLKRRYLETECRRALKNPRLENDFKRYHLNIWVEQAKRWFQMRLWSMNTAHPTDTALWKNLLEMNKGRTAFGALDLGSVNDLTALTWLFPPKKVDGRWTLFHRFWCPEATIEERDSPKTPYKRWRDIGAITATPGNVTDYDFIEQQVMADAENIRCEGLAIDRWNATQVSVHLQNEGLPVAMFGQGFASMGAPSKELERLYMSGKLEHGSHPVAKWMYGNATYRKDPAGNMKPDKERAAEKIDGVVSDIMALGIAQHGVSDEGNLDDFLKNAVMR